MKARLFGRQLWLRGVVSAVVAALVNVGVAALSAQLVGAEPGFLALQPGPVATITVLTVLAGTAVFAGLDRLTDRPVLVFAIVSSVVALASLWAPVALSMDTSGTIADVTPAAALALIPLHLIPAVVINVAVAWPTRAPGPARAHRQHKSATTPAPRDDPAV